jgi:hypothetical protein
MPFRQASAPALTAAVTVGTDAAKDTPPGALKKVPPRECMSGRRVPPQPRYVVSSGRRCQRRPFTTIADHPHLQTIINDGMARKRRREEREEATKSLLEALVAEGHHVSTDQGDFEVHAPDYDTDTATL